MSNITDSIDLQISLPTELFAGKAHRFFLIPFQRFLVVARDNSMRLIPGSQRDRDCPDDRLDYEKEQDESGPDELGSFFFVLEGNRVIHFASRVVVRFSARAFSTSQEPNEVLSLVERPNQFESDRAGNLFLILDFQFQIRATDRKYITWCNRADVKGLGFSRFQFDLFFL